MSDAIGANENQCHSLWDFEEKGMSYSCWVCEAVGSYIVTMGVLGDEDKMKNSRVEKGV